METFAPYGLTLVAIAVFAILGQVLSALSAAKRSGAGYAPGELPPPEFDDPIFRYCRTYHNTVDNVGTFTAAALAAMLTGVAPFWVNLLAIVGILLRLAFVVVYIRGVGPADLGPRSFIYVGQSLTTVLLALSAVIVVML